MRIFSGIQPTGRKHLGNYIGAIAQYVSSQERGEGIFCIVDLHAITVAYDPAELRERLYDTTAILLAAGLDPRAASLFRQSDVRRAHRADLAALQRDRARPPAAHAPVPRQVARPARARLGGPAAVSRCCRPPTCSPTAPQEVPVGEDQREHLELMRDVARRFNARFGDGEEVLVVPEHRIPEVGARIMDLQDPTRKMSTTGGERAGHRVRARRARGDREEAQERGHRLGQRGAPRRREAGRQQPDRNPRGRPRRAIPAAVEAEFAEARYGDFKAAVAARGDRLPGARARALRRSCAPTRRRSRRSSQDGAARARDDRRSRRSPTCASAWASGRRARRERGAPRRGRALRCADEHDADPREGAHEPRRARARPRRLQRAVRPAAHARPARRGRPARAGARRRRARLPRPPRAARRARPRDARPSSSC